VAAQLHNSDAVQSKTDPRRYFERIGEERTPVALDDPVCLYLETTNRCNLLCTTCPRTYEELEPPSDMSWELFTSIVDQFPKIDRVVLHATAGSGGNGVHSFAPLPVSAAARASTSVVSSQARPGAGTRSVAAPNGCSPASEWIA